MNVVKDNKDIQEELKNKYKMIMIDEYQDTSLLQEEFVKLISSNNVYMVGDIKQSIYGFRGSEPSIFADYRKKMPLHTESQAEISDAVCVFMSDNFRCNHRSDILYCLPTLAQ